MDKETIKQIAAEIAAQLPFGERTGPVLVLYVIITAVAAGLAAWFGSFLKTKGQNFATKQDFDELLEQLRANTEVVESVNQVGSRLTPSWLRRSSQKLANGIGPSASGKTYAAASSKRSSTRYKSAMRIWSVAISRFVMAHL